MATLTSPTLGRLITNVRNMLGQPNSTNSNWTDLEITEYLNEAGRLYFAEVLKNSEGYFTATTLLTYTQDIETVSLPVDCYEVKALYIQNSQGWEILQYRNNVTSGFFTNVGAGGPNSYSPEYSFLGNNILLRPVPNATGTNMLRLDYIQFPDQMVNGGDSLTNQISPVFKQLIEVYAVYKAKMKQSLVNGTDLTAIAKGNLSEIYTLFKDTINKRSEFPEYTIPFNPEG